MVQLTSQPTSRPTLMPDLVVIKVGCVKEVQSVELQSEIYVESALKGLRL